MGLLGHLSSEAHRLNRVQNVEILELEGAAEHEEALRDEALGRLQGAVHGLPVPCERPPRAKISVGQDDMCPPLEVLREKLERRRLGVEREDMTLPDTKLAPKDVVREEQRTISELAVSVAPQTRAVPAVEAQVMGRRHRWKHAQGAVERQEAVFWAVQVLELGEPGAGVSPYPGIERRRRLPYDLRAAMEVTDKGITASLLAYIEYMALHCADATFDQLDGNTMQRASGQLVFTDLWY